MKEIRMCWSPMVSHLKHEIQPTANWQRMSRDLREDTRSSPQRGMRSMGQEPTGSKNERGLRPIRHVKHLPLFSYRLALVGYRLAGPALPAILDKLSRTPISLDLKRLVA
jgi:hypothetical protein